MTSKEKPLITVDLFVDVRFRCRIVNSKMLFINQNEHGHKLGLMKRRVGNVVMNAPQITNHPTNALILIMVVKASTAKHTHDWVQL